jgi:dodecin
VASITGAMLGLHLTGVPMSEHVYKTVELVGSSTRGMEDAVQRAIAKAAETVRNLRWFEVVDTRGHIEDGKVAHWQVTLKVGFTLEGD